LPSELPSSITGCNLIPNVEICEPPPPNAGEYAMIHREAVIPSDKPFIRGAEGVEVIQATAHVGEFGL
jgi:hypothetical protein